MMKVISSLELVIIEMRIWEQEFCAVECEVLFKYLEFWTMETGEAREKLMLT